MRIPLAICLGFGKLLNETFGKLLNETFGKLLNETFGKLLNNKYPDILIESCADRDTSLVS